MSGWPVGFLAGLAVPLLVRAAGSTAPALYDSVVLPLLHYAVLPSLGLILLALVFLASFRQETYRGERLAPWWQVSMSLLGLALGVVAVLDWWYIAPFSFASLFSLALWRARWKLWARPASTVATVLTLGLAALLLVLFDVRRGLPVVDDRFGFGFPGWLDGLLVLVLVSALLLLLGLWAGLHWLAGRMRVRAVLSEVIERQPRCSAYFRAVCGATRWSRRPREAATGPKPLPAAASLPRGSPLPALFPDVPGIRHLWTKVFLMACRSLADTRFCLFIRFLRKPSPEPGLPSELFRGMLDEAAQRELEAYKLLALGATQGAEAGDLLEKLMARTEEESKQARTEAARRFARYVLLKQALIDARYYVLAPPRALAPEAVAGELEMHARVVASVLTQRLQAGASRPGATHGKEGETARLWSRASAEYLDLWLENIDRLAAESGAEFLSRGESQAHAPIDVVQLTCNLLAARAQLRTLSPPAGRRGQQPQLRSPGSVHAHAADLALCLFVEELRTREAVDADRQLKILLGYLREVASAMREPLEAARSGLAPASAEDRAELGLACAAYMLLRLARGNFGLAGAPLAVFPTLWTADHQSENSPAMVRAALHVKAAASFRSVRGEGLAHEPQIREAQGYYLAQGMPFQAVCFTLLALRALSRNGAVPESVLAQLKKNVAESMWTPREPERTLPTESGESPRLPVRIGIGTFSLAGTLLAFLLAWFVGNPVARIEDPRLSTQYNDQPPTAVEAGQGDRHVWVATDGGGIKVFDPRRQVFRGDVTASTSPLASDNVLDIAFGPPGVGLAAVVPADPSTRGGGLQIATADYPPVFWKAPVLDLSSFPKLTDESAICVAETPSGEFLLVGTRGHGIGVYHVTEHSWRQPITVAHGLPSDTVHDIVAAPGRGAGCILWAATDKGLCAGTLDGASFKRQWLFDASLSLAEDSVQSLSLQGKRLWYLSNAGGLGRIALDDAGAPATADAHELLVSVRKLAGLEDKDVLRAKGSTRGQSTWFFATVAGRGFLGRYHEKPHDTTGLGLPARLAGVTVNCMAVDPAAGDAVLLGTQDGCWHYRDTRGPGGQLLDIEGGFVGPEGAPVLEALFSGRRAIIKTTSSAPGAPSRLESSTVEAAGVPWRWASFVGPGRFPGLESVDEMRCAAHGPGRTVYFGTSRKGIGIWDRTANEVRLELCTANPEPAGKLRDDTSLDLALINGRLLQVTGDNALDAIELSSRARTALIPPEEAPFPPSEVNAATARGPLFAASGAGQTAIYDASDFSWKHLPGLPDVVRLELTNELLWALDANGKLSAIELGSGAREWRTVAADISGVVARAEILEALIAAPGAPPEVRTFDGSTGISTKRLAPTPLETKKLGWTFGAEVEGLLLLLGDDAAVHEYRLETRAWRRVDFPGGVEPPVRAAARTEGGLWFTDQARRLHAYMPRGGKFWTSLDSEVERLAAAGSSAIVLKRDKPGADLLVRRGDAAPGDAQTLVGWPFEGDLTRVSAAVDRAGTLVAAEGSKVGFYDWGKHGWSMAEVPRGPVTDLFTAADAVWALTGTDDAVLYAWTGSAFDPVKAGAAPVGVQKVVQGGLRLFLLGRDGRVHSVGPAEPAAADLVLAASTVGGDAGRLSSSGHAALLDGDLVVGLGSTLHLYGPSSGVAAWQSFEVDEEVTRLVHDPSESRLLAQGRTNAWVISRSAGSTLTSAVLVPPGTLSTTASVRRVAASRTSSLCAFEVAGENGLRVNALLPGSNRPVEVIGAAMPPGARTLAVAEDPGSGELLRLDAEGRLGSYDPARRSWSLEEAPRLASLHVIGGEVLGYCREEQSLSLRGNRSWIPDSSTRGRIARLSSFKDGLLLWLEDGEICWRGAGGALQRVRPARSPAGAPGVLGDFSAAAEHDGLLALVDTSGRLRVYDWTNQRWLECREKALDLARPSAPQGLYALVERGSQRLLARLERGGDAVEARLLGTRPVEAIAWAGGSLYALASDGAILRLVGGELAPWWGGERSAIHLTPDDVVEAAELAGEDLLLVLSRSAGRPLVLTVDGHSLESSLRELPAERFLRVLQRGPELLVACEDGRGLAVFDLLSGRTASPPDPEVTSICVLDASLYAAKGGGISILEGQRWVPTSFQPGRLPPQPAPEDRAAFAAAGEDLVALLQDGSLHIYRHGAGWTPVGGASGTRLWLAGDRLFLLDEFAPSLASGLREYAAGAWKEPAPAAVGGDRHGAAAFGAASEAAWSISLDTAGDYVMVRGAKAATGKPASRFPVRVRGGRPCLAAEEVQPGAGGTLLVKLEGEEEPRAFELGDDGGIKAVAGTAAVEPEDQKTESSTQEALLRVQLGLEEKAPDGNDSCTVVTAAGSEVGWAIQKSVLHSLKDLGSLAKPVSVGRPLPEGLSPQALIAHGEKVVVLAVDGSLWGFDLKDGFSKIPLPGTPAGETRVLELFRLDAELYAACDTGGLAILRVKPDASGLEEDGASLHRGRWSGRVLASGPLATGTKAWTLPETHGGAFQSPGGAEHRFNAERTAFTADLVEEVQALDRKLLARTAGHVRVFQAAGTALEEVTVPDAEALIEKARRSASGVLRKDLGPFLLQPATGGAWRTPSGRIEILAGDPSRRRELLPSSGGAALAHEVVLDLASDGMSLFAATLGGCLVFEPAAAPRPKLETSPDGVPAAGIETVDAAASTVWAIGGGKAYLRQPPGRWVTAKAPAARTALAAKLKDYEARFLTSWKLPQAAAGGSQRRFSRRLDSGEWATVVLEEDGFTFERVAAVDSAGADLLLYTAGGLVSQRKAGSFVPTAIEEGKWAAPAGLRRGFGSYDVMELPGGRKLLFAPAPSGGLDPGGEAVSDAWARDASSWERAGEADLRSLREALGGPLLASPTWRWERPDSGAGPPADEPVTWRTSGGVPLESSFSPQAGRFLWDLCSDLGQAGSSAWVLTDAGLFEVEGVEAAFSSRRPLEGSRGDRRGLSFCEASGNLPGALLGPAGVAMGYVGGAWRPAGRLPRGFVESVLKYRCVGKVWRVLRDGGFLHSRPQEPSVFDAVELLAPEGRWSFETALDVVAAEGACFLGTRGGIVGTAAGGQGLTGLWGDLGTVAELGVLDGRTLARRSDGTTLEHLGKGWIPAAPLASLAPEKEVRQGERWRTTRDDGKVSFEAVRASGEAPRALSARGGRLFFDALEDARLAAGGAVVLLTAEGLIEREADGDLASVSLEGVPPDTKLELFSVPDARPSGGALFVRSQAGGIYAGEEGWSRLAEGVGRKAWSLSNSLKSIGPRWRVAAGLGPSASLDFELRLPGDPPDVYKPVSFDVASGLFGFDSFRCITTQGAERRLFLGTACGAQVLTGEGTPSRLWCLERLDGIGPGAVGKAAADEEGNVLLESGGAPRVLEGNMFSPAERTRLEAALSLRASDPDGWRVAVSQRLGKPDIDVRWRGQPTFLVPGGRGARFAHNVVHAVEAAGDRIVLGTQAGLAFLSPPPQFVPLGLALWSEPFVADADIRGLDPPQRGIGWIGTSGGDSLYVRLRGARTKFTWRVTGDLAAAPRTPLVLAEAPAPEAAAKAYEDDVLEWRHPEEGRLVVSFVEGKVKPADVKPRLHGGTFSFLDLDVAKDRVGASTLALTRFGLFWSSRAGIVRFDPENDVFIQLQARAGEAAGSLGSLEMVERLHLRLKDLQLFARGPGGCFRFDGGAGGWLPVPPPWDAIDRDDVVSETGMTRWRQLDGGVEVRLRRTDLEGARFFAAGKPRVDVLHALAFAPEAGSAAILLATEAGVARRAAEDFAHERVEASAFAPPGGEAQAVLEVAAAAAEGGSSRICCRLRRGATFERTKDGWRSVASAAEVFEAGYRRVHRPRTWSWSRYPAGLTCTLRETNGPPLALGALAQPSAGPIFSRGRLVFDDARSVVLLGADVLVATPVGIVRYALDAVKEKASYGGTDVWVRSNGKNGLEAMSAVEAVRGLGDGVMAWDRERVYFCAEPRKRRWEVSKRSRDSIGRWYEVSAGGAQWAIEAPAIHGAAVHVSYSTSLIARDWYARTSGGLVLDSAYSDDGLWFLAGGEVFQVSRERAERRFPIALGGTRLSMPAEYTVPGEPPPEPGKTAGK
ncbi:MAG: hypothetical protein HY721_31120 [Planctomycetes bacterium]|nr:hypothetical protein [Planctomycetota bacterium]